MLNSTRLIATIFELHISGHLQLKILVAVLDLIDISFTRIMYSTVQQLIRYAMNALSEEDQGATTVLTLRRKENQLSPPQDSFCSFLGELMQSIQSRD